MVPRCELFFPFLGGVEGESRIQGCHPSALILSGIVLMERR